MTGQIYLTVLKVVVYFFKPLWHFHTFIFDFSFIAA